MLLGLLEVEGDESGVTFTIEGESVVLTPNEVVELVSWLLDYGEDQGFIEIEDEEADEDL